MTIKPKTIYLKLHGHCRVGQELTMVGVYEHSLIGKIQTVHCLVGTAFQFVVKSFTVRQTEAIFKKCDTQLFNALMEKGNLAQYVNVFNGDHLTLRVSNQGARDVNFLAIVVILTEEV